MHYSVPACVEIKCTEIMGAVGTTTSMEAVIEMNDGTGTQTYRNAIKAHCRNRQTCNKQKGEVRRGTQSWAEDCELWA